MDRALRELRHLGKLGQPGPAETAAVNFDPMAIIFRGTLFCSMGRISRTRRSISPSSSMKLGAGICTAARPERSLINRTAR
jgi:hypothetical protein